MSYWKQKSFINFDVTLSYFLTLEISKKVPSWQNRFAKSFWRFLNEWQDVIKWDFHLYFTEDLSSKIQVFRVGLITKNGMVCKHFINMNHPGPTILS